MKLREVSAENLIRFAKIDDADEETEVIEAIIEAGRNFVLSQTGLDLEETDDKPDLAIAMRIIKRREADKSIRTEYRTIKTVWAKVNGLYGREWWEARKYGAEGTVEFTIRYGAVKDLTVKDRILFRGTLYNIVSVDNTLFQDNFLKIKATADLTH